MKTLIIKISSITAIVLACITAAQAQTAVTSSKVTGTVVDAQGPVGYTTVSIIRAKDSTVVAGTLTTEAGAYTFEHIHNGIYLVRAQGVGYLNTFSKPFAVNSNTPGITVPVIRMVSANKTLTTVNITAAKPLIEHQTDKIVMNVAGSVLAAGNSAMDILERAPGVSVDKDDNISLRGKQGVTVMINGKLTYLSSTQLATLLRSTDGNSIQSIELITNPSAKYDAAGNSGIINIVLKKNKESGTNGSLITSGGFSAYANDNTTLSLNHKQGGLNVFGSFNHGDNENGRNLNISRTVTDSGKSTYFNQYNYMRHSNHWNNYRLGADYDLSSQNTIGFIVNGYFSGEQDDNADNTYIGSAPGEVDSIQKTPGIFKQTYKNIAVNVNDRWKLDTMGQELDIDLDYSKFTNNSQNSYVTTFLLGDGTQQQPDQYLQEQTPSTIDIHTAKIDYTKQLTKSLKLEAGVKFSDVKTDNDLEAQKLQNGVYVNDTTKTNRFIYDEKISAGYVNLTKSFNKSTSLEVGLRGEYTQSRGDLVTEDSVAAYKYLNLFPSLFFNHSFSDKNDISFSYSRRIDRPNYEDLNPFVYYLDQYTYQKGNPFLRPQYTNNFEFDYTYNKSLNVSLNYSHTGNAITEIILTDAATKATYQTTLNLQTQDSYSIDINSPYTITKWWSGNAELNIFDLQFRSDSLFGGNLSDGKIAYQIKATQTFTFAGVKVELFSRYNSSMIYGIYHLDPRYSNDIGFSKSFYQKKLNIKFAVTDVFNTWTNNLNANYQADDFTIRQKGQTRGAKLTLTYNFGNSKIKNSEHHSGAEDESQRVKGSN